MFLKRSTNSPKPPIRPCLPKKECCPSQPQPARYQIRDTIMPNKPNFLDALMNVTSFYRVEYENKSNWKLGENKPKQTQFQMKGMRRRLCFKRICFWALAVLCHVSV
jgi:hypothetical protein